MCQKAAVPEVTLETDEFAVIMAVCAWFECIIINLRVGTRNNHLAIQSVTVLIKFGRFDNSEGPVGSLTTIERDDVSYGGIMAHFTGEICAETSVAGHIITIG